MMSQRRSDPTTTVYQPGSGKFLPESKKQTTQRDPLSEDFGSLEEFRAFRDTHSTTDYEDLVEYVDVHINIHSSKVYCAVAEDLLTQLQTHARRQGVSTKTLINLWLWENVMKVAQGSAELFDRQISIVQGRTQIHVLSQSTFTRAGVRMLLKHNSKHYQPQLCDLCPLFVLLRTIAKNLIFDTQSMNTLRSWRALRCLILFTAESTKMSLKCLVFNYKRRWDKYCDKI